LPGNPNPQQHILAPDPPAPHISMVAVPVPGDLQHTPQQKLVPTAVPGLKAHILPSSVFDSKPCSWKSNFVSNNDLSVGI
jgi:hypothetical protein